MVEPIALRLLELKMAKKIKKKSVRYSFFIDFNYFFCNIGKYKTRSHTLWNIGE